MFQSVHKPKTTSLRHKQGAFRNDCHTLRDVVSVLPLPSTSARSTTVDALHNNAPTVGLLHGSKSLAIEIVPFLKQFYYAPTQPVPAPATTFGAMSYQRSDGKHSTQETAASRQGSSLRGVWNTSARLIDIPRVRQCIYSMLTSDRNQLHHHHHQNHHTKRGSNSYQGATSGALEADTAVVDLVAEIGEDIDTFDD